MTYYKCDCGCVFREDEAGSYYEMEGEGVMRGPIYYMCCPECGSDNYEEAEDCMECTEYFQKDELIYLETEVIWGRKDEYHYARFCPDCFKKIKAQIAKGIDEWGIKEEVEEMKDDI